MGQMLVLMAILAFSPARASAQVIWDQWFIVSGPAGAPIGYYRERFEENGEYYDYLHEGWTRSGDQVRAEKIGARARARAALEPVSYHYESGENRVEATLSRTKGVRPSFALKIRVEGKPKGAAAAVLTLPARAVLAPFLPVWLGEKGRLAKPGRMISMSAILPPGGTDLKTQPIQARFQARDAYALKHRAGKIEITRSASPGNSNQSSSIQETWWIDVRGLPVRIERADHTVIERIDDEAKARAFLVRST